MKAGDLIIIVESLPDWSWSTYTTGHIGLIIDIRVGTIDARDPIYEIFFFHSQATHPVLMSFMKLLSELDEKR
jgi:hypothetical protein|tara:strand:+ start:275 stop:493 length:219 start_codon:yes stop_codon:yes gene_type:complete